MLDILGWIIDLLPYTIKSRLISDEERKQRHLEDIKKKVFEPLLKILDDTYIAALEGEKAIIVPTSRHVFDRGGDVTQYGGKIEYRLEVISPDSKSVGTIEGPPKINENLYLDIKEKHYEKFVEDHEKFIYEFESYGKKWLSYANEIQNTIREELSLPLYEGDIGIESFANPSGLADYVIEKVMGINPFQLSIPENRNEILAQCLGLGHGFHMVLKGTPEDVQKCVDLTNRLIKNDEKYDELYPEQGELLNKANDLRNEIDKIVKSYKLKGKKCEYI